MAVSQCKINPLNKNAKRPAPVSQKKDKPLEKKPARHLWFNRGENESESKSDSVLQLRRDDRIEECELLSSNDISFLKKANIHLIHDVLQLTSKDLKHLLDRTHYQQTYQKLFTRGRSVDELMKKISRETLAMESKKTKAAVLHPGTVASLPVTEWSTVKFMYTSISNYDLLKHSIKDDMAFRVHVTGYEQHLEEVLVPYMSEMPQDLTMMIARYANGMLNEPNLVVVRLDANLRYLEHLVNHGECVLDESLLMSLVADSVSYNLTTQDHAQVKNTDQSQMKFMERMSHAIHPTIENNRRLPALQQQVVDTWQLKLHKHQVENLAWMMQVEGEVASGYVLDRTMGHYMTKWPGTSCNITFDLFHGRYHLPSNSATATSDQQPQGSVERLFSRGGVLADEVGTGKTLSCLSLILMTLDRTAPRAASSRLTEQQLLSKPLYECEATLVVVPNRLVKQWKEELETKASVEKLNVVTVLDKRQHEKLNYRDVMHADIVIVSSSFLQGDYYTSLSGFSKTCIPQTRATLISNMFYELQRQDLDPLEHHAPMLEHFEWKRLVLDEAHECCLLPDPHKEVDFKSTPVLKIICDIQSKYRWYVSGTPLPHGIMSLYGLAEFLGLAIVDTQSQLEYDMWSRYEFTRSVLWLIRNHLWSRHTADSVRNSYSIPGLQQEIIVEELHPVERYMYNALLHDGRPSQQTLLAACGGLLHTQAQSQVQNKAQAQADTQSALCASTGTWLGRGRSRSTSLNQDIEARKKQIIYLEKSLKTLQTGIGDLVQKRALLIHEEAQLKLSLQHSIPVSLKRSLEKVQLDMKQVDEQLATDKKLIEGTQHAIRTDTREITNGQRRLKELTRAISLCSSTSKLGNRNTDPGQCRCEVCDQTTAQANAFITCCGHVHCESCLIIMNSSHPRACRVCDLVTPSCGAYQIEQQSEAYAPLPLSDKMRDKYGSKVSSMLHYLNTLLLDTATEARVIIFSQRNGVLDKVASVLGTLDIKTAVCRGNVHVQNKAITTFKTSKDVRVILLSSERSASGLNLQEATHIFLLDSILGEVKAAVASEMQAIARAHRQGQSKVLKVVRFLTRGTVEHEQHLRVWPTLCKQYQRLSGDDGGNHQSEENSPASDLVALPVEGADDGRVKPTVDALYGTAMTNMCQAYSPLSGFSTVYNTKDFLNGIRYGSRC